LSDFFACDEDDDEDDVDDELRDEEGRAKGFG